MYFSFVKNTSKFTYCRLKSVRSGYRWFSILGMRKPPVVDWLISIDYPVQHSSLATDFAQFQGASLRFSEMLTEVLLVLKKIESNLKMQLLEILRIVPCMYAWIITQNRDALIIPTYNYSSWAKFSVSWPFGSGTCKHFRLQVKHCNLHRWTNSPCPGFQGKIFLAKFQMSIEGSRISHTTPKQHFQSRIPQKYGNL